MTTIELVEEITDWEAKYGESFNDSFTHDNVKDVSWAFWLLGKGYTKHALVIIDELCKGKTCIDQQVLYEIYQEYDDCYDHGYNETNVLKNNTLIAEFLLATPHYAEIVKDWFDEWEKDCM